MCESIVTTSLVMPVLLALWCVFVGDRGKRSWTSSLLGRKQHKIVLGACGCEESLLRAERWLICHPEH